MFNIINKLAEVTLEEVYQQIDNPHNPENYVETRPNKTTLPVHCLPNNPVTIVKIRVSPTGN
jgi:hypothetical protein